MMALLFRCRWTRMVPVASSLTGIISGVPCCMQVQKGKDEVMLEFPADDTAGGDHEDALFEMSFHVPKENDRFGTEDENSSAAEVTTCLSTQWCLAFCHSFL